MGGTGLEPVTPSLSIRGSVRVSSLEFAQSAWLSGNTSSTERLSERERTRILAILATGSNLRGWCSVPNPRAVRVSDAPAMSIERRVTTGAAGDAAAFTTGESESVRQSDRL